MPLMVNGIVSRILFLMSLSGSGSSALCRCSRIDFFFFLFAGLFWDILYMIGVIRTVFTFVNAGQGLDSRQPI